MNCSVLVLWKFSRQSFIRPLKCAVLFITLLTKVRIYVQIFYTFINYCQMMQFSVNMIYYLVVITIIHKRTYYQLEFIVTC